jgi:phosphotransferase system enzyme I (PtsI)
MRKRKGKDRVICGVAASPGIMIGESFFVRRDEFQIEEEILDSREVEPEIQKFRVSLAETKKELEALRERVSERLAPQLARIFDPQVMVLEDQVLNNEVERQIRESRRCAEFVYRQEMSKAVQALNASSDNYIRERILDINAVSNRVIEKLLGIKRRGLLGLRRPAILLAHSVTPGEVVHIANENILGMALELGGGTSHVALLAKALQIPAVVGLREDLSGIEDGTTLILDAFRGELLVDPSLRSLRRYRSEARSLEGHADSYRAYSGEEGCTLDGRRVQIQANIELTSEIQNAVERGAEGVGLFRTEYLYLIYSRFPDEEEQFREYKLLAQKMAGRPVIIRTFDFGGDKFLESFGRTYELNPFLGWRAIRISLDRPDFFKIQIRAILRASHYGNVKMMLPMISTKEEVRRAKEIIEEVKFSLKKKSLPFEEEIELGIMIETPAAALMAESLAPEVDFFSIGTNDLVQYTLAVDRGNELVSGLFQTYHPSVLKLVRETIEAGHRHNLRVGICGEIAGDPLATTLLVGLGIDELSLNPLVVPSVKRVVCSIEYESAKEVASLALEASSAEEVKAILHEDFHQRFAGVQELQFFHLE